MAAIIPGPCEGCQRPSWARCEHAGLRDDESVAAGRPVEERQRGSAMCWKCQHIKMDFSPFLFPGLYVPAPVIPQFSKQPPYKIACITSQYVSSSAAVFLSQQLAHHRSRLLTYVYTPEYSTHSSLTSERAASWSPHPLTRVVNDDGTTVFVSEERLPLTPARGVSNHLASSPEPRRPPGPGYTG